MTDTAIEQDRTPQRVRHELRFRKLEVSRVERLTPHLVRITLAGDELEGFYSPGFDDHAKIFFPDASGKLVVPTVGPDGPSFPEGPKPLMRDYTPRRYDPAARTLEIEFALHEPMGPATAWAAQAAVGQRLGVGGPRGSFMIPTDFDGHVLIGDDTALPAMARRLRELPAGAKVLVLAEVDGAADRMEFETGADAAVHWVYRNGAAAGASPLLDALRPLTLPSGDVHAWVACESGAAKALRAHLVGERGLNPKWVKAAGYWRAGTAATHDTHND